MPPIGRQTRSATMQELTPQEIQSRWSALLPKVSLWLGISAAVSIGVFLFNHFGSPGERLVGVLNTAFQIGCIFTICFAFLTIAAIFFKSNLWIKKGKDASGK